VLTIGIVYHNYHVHLFLYTFVTRQRWQRHVIGLSVRRDCPFGRSSGQIMLPLYLMNGLGHLHETYMEY